MAFQDLVYIDFPNNPRHGDSMSYRINKNGSPITYSGTGQSVVSKTFIDHQTVTRGNINYVGPTNLVATGIDFGTGFNAAVNRIVKVVESGVTYYYVGGNFTSYKGVTAYGLVKLNSDGTLNTTFNTNLGSTVRITLSDGSISGGGFIRDIKIQSDGKLVICGVFRDQGATYSGVLRLNTNGTIDNKLGGGLWSNTNSNSGSAAQGNSIVINSEGKIFVGGFFRYAKSAGTNYNNRSSFVYYYSDGSLGAGSPAFQDISSSNAAFISSMDLDSTGTNIFVGGSFYFVSSSTRPNVCKLSIGAGFGGVSLVSGFGTDMPNTVRVQRVKTNIDGNLLIGGTFTTLSMASKIGIAMIDGTTGANSMAVAYFSASIVNTSGTINVNEIKIDSNNKILVGGNFNQVNGVSRSHLVRLNQNGTIDTTFNNYIYGPSSPNVSTIEFNGSNILVGGFFQTFEGGIPSFTSVNTPIGATIADTLENLRQSLVYFESDPEVNYVSDGISRLTVELDFDINSDTVLVDSISDTTNYVEIALANSDLGISPIVVQTRSPHFVVRPVETGATYVRYELRFYRGEYNVDTPVDPTYTITKTITTLNQSNFYVDITPLARDFISSDIDSFMSPTVIQNMGTNETIWLKLDTQEYNGTPSKEDPVGSGSTVQYIAIDGFGYPEQGVNPQPPKILLSGDEMQIWRDGQQRIYFNTNGLLKTLKSFDPDFSSAEVVYIGGGDTSFNDQYFQSIKIDTFGAEDVVYYRLEYDNNTSYVIKYNIIDECRNDVKQLIFKNKHGVLQSIDFFKRHDRKYSMDRKDYDRSILNASGSFNPRKHTKFTYLVTGTEEITLNSGFVREYMNPYFKELMLSDEVYINDDGIIRPCTITDKDWSEKIGVNEKLINYTVKVEIAHNIINNIR